MSKCAFCEKPLPEPGYTKFFVVRDSNGDHASCVQCNLTMKTKVIGLMSPVEEPSC